MQSATFAVLLYGALALAPVAAEAQQGNVSSSPTDPAAPVPGAAYDSAFTRFAPFREERLAPWREVNDEVARVGGHVGTLRGANAIGSKPAAKGPAAGAAGK